MAREELVFVNDRPIAQWTDFALRIGLAAFFVGLYGREYHVRLVEPVVDSAMLAALWLLGCMASILLYGRPRIRLTIGAREVVVLERWIGRSRIERFPLKRIAHPAFIEEKDYEGDPYFRGTITTPSGRAITFSEHGNQAIVEAARDKVIAALG